MKDDALLVIIGLGVIAVVGLLAFAMAFTFSPRPYTSVVTVERDSAGRITAIVERVTYSGA